MYVCVCNAYRESQVREAIKKSATSGAVTLDQVYARLGKGPQCGRCVISLMAMINEGRGEKPAESEAAY